MNKRLYYIAMSNAHFFTAHSSRWQAEACRHEGDLAGEAQALEREKTYLELQEAYNKMAKEVIE